MFDFEQAQATMNAYEEHKGTDTAVVCPLCEENHPANQIDAGWSGRYGSKVVGLCPTTCECLGCVATGICEIIPK